MPSFFDKPFAEQVEEIMRTGDLKLLQALIGTRAPIGLSLYCSSFFLTRTVIAQAKYQAYSALLNVLTEYQKAEKEIFVDNIKRDIERQISGNEDRLRQKALLPSSSNNLKSLTNNSCSDLESYVQETDVSSLCTFNLQKVIEIYHNYISREEIKNLEKVILKGKEMEDRYSYIESQKTNLQYNSKREKARNTVKDNEPLLLKIKDKTFFDSWYKKLLYEVLCEAEMNKKHILHEEIVKSSSPYMKDKINSAKSKLGTSFNKEAVRRVINKLVNDYIKILPTSFGVKESLLSYMKCVDIDDYRGRMNYEAVNHRIISRANEVILSESIVQNSLSDDVERGLQYIVDRMDVSLLTAVEQEMLNEIAERAASYRERDNKKKDLELLSICNGGEFEDKLSLPTDLSFSEIERLYKDMLSIEFKEQGEFELHKLCERLPLLELEEIKEAFPASITEDILKSMVESLNKYVEIVKKVKKDIVDKVFGKQENLEKLYKLEQELEFSFMQRLFHPIYYGQYKEIKSFVECKSFIHDNIKSEKDVTFRERLEEQLRKLDKPKREELERLLLSSIDNEFQGLVNQLIFCKDELEKKARKEFRLPKLFHPSYWESYIERENHSLKICEEALKKSVATGDDELFYQAVEDIKKNSNYMWVFQVNKALFDGVYKTQHDSRKKTLSFRELAEKFIGNRKKHIADQQDEYKIRKATAEQRQVNVELAGKDIINQEELHAMAASNEILGKKAEEAEARAEEERRAKEEERRAREKAEAKTKAIDLLYDEADDHGISTKRIKQNEDVQKFLKCQYTFLVLNEDCITKFKGLCREYRNLRREIKEPNFERLSELANEFDRLSSSFAEREREEEESRENVPGCNDQSIDRLKLSIVTRVVQGRDVAEREKRTVEKEKTEVEEIVKRLQMQAPNSAFSSVSHELVAGTSQQI
ncbi:hypothetical protein [Wolbachia endosymbiont (group A) of Epagoge grotiana]|uniref:hypothetical protein n=1 Tax=Wolbachia endosymbiont (group A) of Epagoge grotiana TaxID=2954006 RepID=UPI00223167F8|nr:hypothetical protein [Wolbachia endosymbiont (group A) of Epagoge grotiana]